MNIVESFANFLEAQGIATLNTNLFIGVAPSTNVSTDDLWWVKASGGFQDRKLTGESVKTYSVQTFYRDRDGGAVYQKLFDLEELLNCNGCADLDGFEVVNISTVSFPADQDLDQEDRLVGLLQTNISVYVAC